MLWAMAEKVNYLPVATGPNVPVSRREPGQLWRQFFYGSIASSTVLLIGYVMCWTSPVNKKLQDASQSPFNVALTKTEEAWVGSILNLGAILGPFIGGPLATKFGRKLALLTSVGPVVVGLILVIIAKNVFYVYAARFLWGVSCGMIFTLAPMYCTEIATVEARGTLGAFLQLFITIGFVIIFSVGPYVSYYAVAYVGIGLAGFFPLSLLLPESPKYYLLHDDRDSAAASLMKLRGRSRAGVEEELLNLIDEIDASTDKTGKFADLFKGTNFKAFYMSCTLMFFQQFSGINAVLFYTTNIFDAAGSEKASAVYTILIGVVQVSTSVVSLVAVEKIGRKGLLLISTSGTTVSLGVLGLYFILDHHKNSIVECLSFVPVVTLIIYIVAYTLGLGPMPWVVFNELIPMELKSVASPLGTSFCWILSFAVTRFFGPLAEAVGMHVVFWLFGACCATGFAFTLFIVPETKGRTSLEIQDVLTRKCPWWASSNLYLFKLTIFFRKLKSSFT